jgi:recombinational DNA repair protein RecR
MRISDRKRSSCEVVKVEEDWEEELDNIQDEIDEICSRVTSCEDCPWEVCGDLCEIICEDEEEELREGLGPLRHCR